MVVLARSGAPTKPLEERAHHASERYSSGLHPASIEHAGLGAAVGARRMRDWGSFGPSATAHKRDFVAEPGSEQALVDALWAFHEREIAKVLLGVQTGTRKLWGAGGPEFDRAIDFFESVTRIFSNTAWTHGRAITPELESTFSRWQLWYRSNRLRLLFDPGSCEIRVSELPPMPSPPPFP